MSFLRKTSEKLLNPGRRLFGALLAGKALQSAPTAVTKAGAGIGEAMSLATPSAGLGSVAKVVNKGSRTLDNIAKVRHYRVNRVKNGLPREEALAKTMIASKVRNLTNKAHVGKVKNVQAAGKAVEAATTKVNKDTTVRDIWNKARDMYAGVGASQRLGKYAATAYKDKMHELSPEAIKKIKDSGAMKSDIKMIAGMNKGTKNIVKKNGGEISKLNGSKRDFAIGLQTGGYATEEGNKVRHIGRKDVGKQMLSPLHRKTSDGLERAWTNALGKRHEAIETKFSGATSGKVKMNKHGKPMFKKNKKNLPGDSSQPMRSGSRSSKAGGTGTFLKDINAPKSVAQNHPMMGVDQKGKAKVATGSHHSAGVLAEEMKTTNRMQHRKAAEKFKDMRTETGERDAIQKKIGKDPYGKGKITKSDINKAHSSKKGTASFDGGSNFFTGKQNPDHLQSNGNPHAYKKGKVSGAERAGRAIGKTVAPALEQGKGMASKLLKLVRR